MATVRLSDVKFDPDVYLSYLQELRTDRNDFAASGVAVTNPELTTRAGGEGDITSIPFWKDLDSSDENIGTDDPAVRATPDKIETGRLSAARVHINNAWQTANLVSAVLGTEDPMRRIAALTSSYWNDRFARRLMATVMGVYNDNVASGGSDMVESIATEDGNNATAANRFSFDAFVDALASMGESQDKLAAMAVHPEVYKTIQKQNNIEFIQDSVTGVMIPTYNGKRLIVDKKMPAIAGTTSGVKYVSVLFGQGAIGYGEALAPRPVAVEYDELAANGAGVETLIERKQWIIHPAGFRWTAASVASVGGPSVAEVQLATNWERQYQRENIPLAFLVTN